MNLSIIIVNYNLSNEIRNCLTSLFKFLKNIKYEIIIVDNNSTEKDLILLEKEFLQKNIIFYYLNENLGFGGGCNFGFTKASGNIICFLNPDTIIKEDIFSPIIDLLVNQYHIGIVGPQQLTRKPFFDFSAGFKPNIFFQLFHLIGLGVFFEGMITYLYSKLKNTDYFCVDWILGAAIFIRKELFNEIKGFDKDFFMFSEEVDLCRRVSEKGYKIIYYPKLKIYHIGSVSGRKDYKLFTIRTYSSKDIYFSKHYHFIEKFLMKFLLRIELFTQIMIWLFLYPANKKKSSEKLQAFLYLIRNNLKYNNSRSN